MRLITSGAALVPPLPLEAVRAEEAALVDVRLFMRDSPLLLLLLLLDDDVAKEYLLVAPAADGSEDALAVKLFDSTHDASSMAVLTCRHNMRKKMHAAVNTDSRKY